MTLLLILGSLGLIILGMFYIGWGRDNNNLMDNIKQFEGKEEEITAHKLNTRTLSSRAQRCIKGMHIHYVHELESLNKEQLLSRRGVGKSTAKEIEDWATINYNVTIK